MKSKPTTTLPDPSARCAGWLLALLTIGLIVPATPSSLRASPGASRWEGTEAEILAQVRERFVIEGHPELIQAFEALDPASTLEEKLNTLALEIVKDGGRQYRPFLLRRLLFTAANDDIRTEITLQAARKLAKENLTRLDELTEPPPNLPDENDLVEVARQKREAFLRMRIEVTANILFLYGDEKDIPLLQGYAKSPDYEAKHFGEVGEELLRKRLAKEGK